MYVKTTKYLNDDDDFEPVETQDGSVKGASYNI